MMSGGDARGTLGVDELIGQLLRKYLRTSTILDQFYSATR